MTAPQTHTPTLVRSSSLAPAHLGDQGPASPAGVSDSSAPPCAARLGQHGMAVPVEVANSGALARAVNPGPVARYCSGAAQDRSGIPDARPASSSLRADHTGCSGDTAHTDLSVGTAAVSNDAPVSAAAGFSEAVIEARVREMLTGHAYKRAARDHRARKRLHRQWVRAKAALAAMGG